MAKSKKKTEEVVDAWADVAEASEEAKAADLLPDPAKAETLPAPESSPEVGKATERDRDEQDDALSLAGTRAQVAVTSAIDELRTHFQFSPLSDPPTIKDRFPGETRRFASTATDSLTPEEREHVAMETARGLAQKGFLVAVKGAFAEAYKALEKEVDTNLGMLSAMYRRGKRTTKITAVECRDEITQTIHILRADTGAQVSARAMTLEERQRGLDFLSPPPSPSEPDHDDDGVLISDEEAALAATGE